MKSKWFELKDDAVKLRKKGLSIREIEVRLGIPRSTLSGWLRDIKLARVQKQRLYKNWVKALSVARKKAAVWHNEQKASRIREAENRAREFFQQPDYHSRTALHLAMALLYLGEGMKTSPGTALGNSDSEILKFFVKALIKEFKVPLERFRCELHLRADQDKDAMKKYWSKELEIPLNQFTVVYFDPRTKGRATYGDYRGVCIVRCGSTHIQRYLVSLSRLFIQDYVSLI